jgi:hypothetical protein
MSEETRNENLFFLASRFEGRTATDLAFVSHRAAAETFYLEDTIVN